MLRSSPAGNSHRCETPALPPSTHAPCSAALSPERGCAVCKSHVAVISLALLQPLVLVGLPPHTPPGYAANHTSRLFRLRSCNRSCSWGYRPTPRQGTRQITRRGYFACAPATARARGATAPHPAGVRKYSHLQRRPPTTHPLNAARGLAVASVARRKAPALYPTRPCFSPLAECPPRV